MELKNKVAVITGGSGGIGRAMAKAFLKEGANAVVLVDLNEAAVMAAANELGCDGEVCDVTNEDPIASAIYRLVRLLAVRQHLLQRLSKTSRCHRTFQAYV